MYILKKKNAQTVQMPFESLLHFNVFFPENRALMHVSYRNVSHKNGFLKSNLTDFPKQRLHNLFLKKKS